MCHGVMEMSKPMKEVLVLKILHLRDLFFTQNHKLHTLLLSHPP